MKTRDQLIESVSRMMAAAYWRGRLHEAFGAGPVDGNPEREKNISNTAENDKARWVESAKVACGDALL